MYSIIRTSIFLLLFFPSFLSAQPNVIDYYIFKDSSVHIEGISTGITPGTFYFSGVNTGELYKLKNNVITKYSIPSNWPRWSLLGMKTETSRQLLFIARSALPQSPDTIDKYHASDVIVFDLRIKSFTKRFPMSDHKGAVLFNDIAIGPGGRVLVSDGGRPGGVYELNYDEGLFRSLNTKGIKSPQGIVALDTVIYIASYTEGLYRYSFLTNTSVFVPVSNLAYELHFIDGLALHENKLIGICNGDRRSIISIDLQTFRGTVLADLGIPQYKEPTLGTTVGDSLYFVSNSQWESYGVPGKVTPVRMPAIISRILMSK